MSTAAQTRIDKIQKQATADLGQVRFNESLRYGVNTAASIFTLVAIANPNSQDGIPLPEQEYKNGDKYYDTSDGYIYIYNGSQ